MKIYLASTAPGNEGSKDLPALPIPKRLLSYHHIMGNVLGSTHVFQDIVQKGVTRDKPESTRSRKSRPGRKRTK